MGPQLALWHSFSNEAPGDFGSAEGRPGWMYGVRQYGMHTLLTYLTEVAGIDRDIVTSGFYANTELSPQEYFVSRVGGEVFRRQLIRAQVAGFPLQQSLLSEAGLTMCGISPTP